MARVWAPGSRVPRLALPDPHLSLCLCKGVRVVCVRGRDSMVPERILCLAHAKRLIMHMSSAVQDPGSAHSGTTLSRSYARHKSMPLSKQRNGAHACVSAAHLQAHAGLGCTECRAPVDGKGADGSAAAGRHCLGVAALVFPCSSSATQRSIGRQAA